MFEIGTYIVCGQHGVCRVDGIGKLEMTEASKDREYYTLSQVYSKGGSIYVPVDSDKIVMRPVVSKEDAEMWISRIGEIEILKIENERRKEEVFKQAFKTCSYQDWTRVIKTLNARKRSRLARGKKVTASDERYLKTAEDNLYGELAISLGIDKNDVEQYIANRIRG